MLKFLFRNKAKAVQKNQRQTVTELMEDLNTIIATMPDKPKIVVDPNTGNLSLDLPDQMPDEALALPAPETAADEKSD